MSGKPLCFRLRTQTDLNESHICLHVCSLNSEKSQDSGFLGVWKDIRPPDGPNRVGPFPPEARTQGKGHCMCDFAVFVPQEKIVSILELHKVLTLELHEILSFGISA